MKLFKNVFLSLILLFFLSGINPLKAQEWKKANGNLYTMPVVKVGIGTLSPARPFESRFFSTNYIRVSSVGGNQFSQYSAGIELRRSLLNGGGLTWTLENNNLFKIKRSNHTILSMSRTEAWLGTSLSNPIEFTIYGKSISANGNSISGGALNLQSKIGNATHNLRIDGNQMESKTNLYFNASSDMDLIMAKGGGDIRVGNSGSTARLNVESDNKFQLNLTNPGTGGGTWNIGVANQGWAAGSGKLVFSKTTSSANASMVITPAGKVGIGLTTPSRTLHVNGTTRTKVLEITGGADLAEPFKVSEQEVIEAGTVVSIDPNQTGQLKQSNQAYDRKVAGVISGAGGINPGMIMGQEGTIASGEHPVALSGRVYCKVDAKYGAIQAGDLLTTSKTPGHAMKVSNHDKAQGAIIGKAMSSLDEGTGLVLVLISLQ